MLAEAEEQHSRLLKWAEHGNLTVAPLSMVYANLDLLHKLLGLTQQHLPVLEFLNSVGLFERSFWETLDYLLEGVNSDATGAELPFDATRGCTCRHQPCISDYALTCS